jgi:2-amino-4-hydroxy-6-hydroxymethyldihydropteridine diphosphokinase
MSTCLISIGSNLGDPDAQVCTCVDILRQHQHLKIGAVSRLQKTKPVGGPLGQGEFVNAAVRIETRLSPNDVLLELQQIENRLGRTRGIRWAPRVIDLDLLLYDDLVLHTEDLEVPHPRMAFRRFVVEPASEIASDMSHPLIGWTVSQIAAHLEKAANYIALTGIPGTGKTAIVRAVAGRVPVNTLLSDAGRSDLLGRDPAKLVAEEMVIMERRKEMLKTIPAAQPRDSAHRDSATLTVSDFWFEQSASHVECFLTPKLQAEPLFALEALIPFVPQPKLLVVLERSLANDDRAKVEETRLCDRTPQLQRRIVERARIPNRGPTLWLDAQDLPRAVDEIVAAFEAMQ